MKVIFDRAHTHAGADYAPEQSAHVDAPTADWLIAHGIAHAADAAEQPPWIEPQKELTANRAALKRSRDRTDTATGDDDHE